MDGSLADVTADDWRALYFTSRTHLGSVNLKIAGISVPAPKRS